MKNLHRIQTILKAIEGLTYQLKVHNTPRYNHQLELWTQKLYDVVFAEEEEECEEPVAADDFDRENIVF